MNDTAVAVVAIIVPVLILAAYTAYLASLARRMVEHGRHLDDPPAGDADLVDRYMRERVVVTLTSGAAFDGLLVEHDPRVWVLRDAVAVGAGDRDASVPVDGEVVILTGTIDYAQRP